MSAPPLSLFGKLPSTLDYVRVNLNCDAAIALDDWLKRCVNELAVAKSTWPADRMRFVFSTPEAADALVGVLAPSRDRAGRKFPVCIFGALPMTQLKRSLPALPHVMSAFMEETERALDALSELPREALAARLSELPWPTAYEGASAPTHAAVGSAEVTVRHIVSELFPGDASAAAAALQRFTDACRSYAAGTAAYGLTLDCPIREAQDVAVWLAAATRELLADSPLSCFWHTGEAERRLMLSLGPASASIPCWWSNPLAKSKRLVSLIDRP